MKNAILYGASLDPITNGHLWVIEQGARMCSKLVIGVAVDPAKTYTFTTAERIELVEQSCCLRLLRNVDVVEIPADIPLVECAENMGIEWVLRGLRDESDFLFERRMAYINADISQKVTTEFPICPPGLSHISSSMVKQIARLKSRSNPLTKYVTRPVYDALMEKFRPQPEIVVKKGGENPKPKGERPTPPPAPPAPR